MEYTYGTEDVLVHTFDVHTAVREGWALVQPPLTMLVRAEMTVWRPDPITGVARLVAIVDLPRAGDKELLATVEEAAAGGFMAARHIRVSDILAIEDIGNLAGVKPATVRQWRGRYKTFPVPLRDHPLLFGRPEILQWLASERPPGGA